MKLGPITMSFLCALTAHGATNEVSAVTSGILTILWAGVAFIAPSHDPTPVPIQRPVEL